MGVGSSSGGGGGGRGNGSGRVHGGTGLSEGGVPGMIVPTLEEEINPVGPPYMFAVQGTETATASPIYRSFRMDIQPQLAFAGCYTLYETFLRGMRLSRNAGALGYRPVATLSGDGGNGNGEGEAGPYVWLSYADVYSMMDEFGAGLVKENMMEENEDGWRLLGLYSKNCVSWTVAELACYSRRGVTVPFYDTLGPDTVEYIVNQTGLHTVVCGASETDKLIQVASRCPSLQFVVQMQPVSPATRAAAEDSGLKLYSFEEVCTIGRAYPSTHQAPSGEDIATFCYTSGTTGNPKGALISHRNFMSCMAAAMKAGIQIETGDTHFSYLPLAHIYERLVQACVLANGCRVAFFQGDVTKLADDWMAAQPTLLPMVPRILNRIYDKIMAGVAASSATKRSLFQMALKTKLDNMHQHGIVKHRLWDAIIFNKLKAAIGLGNVRLMVSGSAPLAAAVLDFWRVVMGIPIIEGYGQTEGTAAGTCTSREDLDAGTVGGVAPVCELKLVDVPEMGYHHTDRVHGGTDGANVVPCVGRGEICIRGPNVFMGYYKMPDKTAETVDKDGWLLSGDIGLITPLGQVRIIDRKKNIFKLSQGEYVAAEKIENVHQNASLVAQSFVYGDSLKDCLVAVIVPDAEPAMEWAQKNGVSIPPGAATDPPQALPTLCTNADFQKAVYEQILHCCEVAGFAGFEIVRDIFLESQELSVENGMLTPTMKLRRAQARDHYRAKIDEMYRNIERGSSISHASHHGRAALVAAKDAAAAAATVASAATATLPGSNDSLPFFARSRL